MLGIAHAKKIKHQPSVGWCKLLLKERCRAPAVEKASADRLLTIAF
jgi:hypothetical protein